MAAAEKCGVKRKLYFNKENSLGNEFDYDSDDSVKDKDYVQSENCSGSSTTDSEQSTLANEGNAAMSLVTPSFSRGALPTPEKGGPSRWRKENLESRLKNERKIKRNLGHSYTNKRGEVVASREMGPPCRCRNRCRQLLSGNENHLFSAFWNLGDYDKHNIDFFREHEIGTKETVLSKKKKTKRQTSSRNITVQYFVKVNGVDVKVCKEEFLAVHGLRKSKKRIQLLYKQFPQGSSTPKSDKRGKHVTRKNKISDECYQNIKKHIESIPKYTSHYSRQRNPKKVYIDHDLSISALYKDYYLEWCKERSIQPAKEDKYRRIFCTEYNTGFKLPKSDTCKTCDLLNIQIKNENNDEEEMKALKFKLELHQRRAEAMQTSLKVETEKAKETGQTCVITFDFQQVLPVPNLTVGPAFYLRKAWTYNLGIHDCVNDRGYMYMWPENVAKRGSDEVASILYKHFKTNQPQAEKLIVFTDNCCGQNKNWSIICLWQQLINEGIFRTIEHQFLVVGHTHLPCDRDFALIEKYKRHHMKQAYVPEDWYTAVEKCRRKNPFQVNVLKPDDILCFRELQNQVTKKALTDQKQKLNFSKICCFKFSYENTNLLHIKHAFNEEYKTANIGKKGLRKSVSLSKLKQKYHGPVALNLKRISNLAQLIQYIPPIHHNYYQEIGVPLQKDKNQVQQKESQENDVENLDEFSDIDEGSEDED